MHVVHAHAHVHAHVTCAFACCHVMLPQYGHLVWWGVGARTCCGAGAHVHAHATCRRSRSEQTETGRNAQCSRTTATHV